MSDLTGGRLASLRDLNTQSFHIWQPSQDLSMGRLMGLGILMSEMNLCLKQNHMQV